MMDSLLNDLRYAGRTLARSPGFAAAAVLTLALGIGGSTAIFSAVNAVLLRPLPFEKSDRLALAFGENPASGWDQIPLSYPNYTDLRDGGRAFEGLAAWTSFTDTRFALTGRGDAQQVQYALATHNLFDVLRVRPALGRGFTPAHDEPGAERVVVVSHELWRQRLRGAPDAVGQTLVLDGAPYTVIGVLPKDFRFVTFPRLPDVWLPMGADPLGGRRYARGVNYLGVIGRLKEGVTHAQAGRELAALGQRLSAEHPNFNTGLAFTGVPLREQSVGEVRSALLLLLGAVGLLLLIACANVANLLLARASARRREIGIRVAIGAAPGRIARQLLTESVLLSALGGVAGLLLAVWGIEVMRRVPLAPPSPFVPFRPGAADIRLDAAVLAFALGVAVLTGLVFGLAPALQSARADVQKALRGGTAGSAPGRVSLRSALVVGQVALSLTLLAGAGLLAKSFVRLRGVDAGFDARGVVTADVMLGRGGYADPDRIDGFYRQVVDRMNALPGVRAAGAVEALPLSGADESMEFRVEGRPAAGPGEEVATHPRAATPGYFGALGIGLVRGRMLSDADDAHAQPVAVINQTMARRYFAGEDPVGRRVALVDEALVFRGDGPPELDWDGAWRVVVGVVADVRHAGPAAEPVPEMHVPAAQRPSRDMTLVVRGAGDPAGLATLLRREVRAVDPGVPVPEVRTMRSLVEGAVGQPRLRTLLLGAFAAVALLLAAVGLYGVVSYTVARRARELGIRMALGARGGEVARLVLRQGMGMAAAGAALGLVGAWGAGRLLRGLLFGVSPADPATFAAVAVFLCAVALLASWIPARRAARIDPIAALRME